MQFDAEVSSKMSNFVYLSRIPMSGLGNQLFSLNALLQAAQLHNVEAIMPASASKIALGMVRPGLLVKRRFQLLAEYIPPVSVLSSADQILSARELKGANMLKAPFLGDSFHHLTLQDPALLFRKPALLSWSDEKRYVAAHFRGGDFAKWNPDAILDTDYYFRSLDYALDVVGENASIYVSTDDDSLPSYRAVLERYQSRLVGCDARNSKNNALLYDFRALAGADLVISSPSTFAIWASILGKRKVIHSKDWVTSRIQSKDQFWINMLSGDSPYYSCEALM